MLPPTSMEYSSKTGHATEIVAQTAKLLRVDDRVPRLNITICPWLGRCCGRPTASLMPIRLCLKVILRRFVYALGPQARLMAQFTGRDGS